jgi:hypothetical protein
MVMIDSYSFGNIVIDGKTYTSDVILYPDKVDEGWWRKEGHLLLKEDLMEIIHHHPDVLIVGTGAYDLMKVPDETKQFLKAKEIELIAEDTEKACKTYNNMKDKRSVIAAFHLTC